MPSTPHAFSAVLLAAAVAAPAAAAPPEPRVAAVSEARETRASSLPAPPPPPPPPASASPAGECSDQNTSLVVNIRYPNGERETYARELESMDVVFDEGGRPTLIHMILKSGPEKDTHKWFQFQGLSSFSYRFCSITGKGKVRLSVLQPFFKDGTAPPAKQNQIAAPELPPLSPKDYR